MSVMVVRDMMYTLGMEKYTTKEQFVGIFFHLLEGKEAGVYHMESGMELAFVISITS